MSYIVKQGEVDEYQTDKHQNSREPRKDGHFNSRKIKRDGIQGKIEQQGNIRSKQN